MTAASASDRQGNRNREDEIVALYYALLLKDLGCRSNAASNLRAY